MVNVLSRTKTTRYIILKEVIIIKDFNIKTISKILNRSERAIYYKLSKLSNLKLYEIQLMCTYFDIDEDYCIYLLKKLREDIKNENSL